MLDLVWYGFVILVFYRKELNRLFGVVEDSSALNPVPNRSRQSGEPDRARQGQKVVCEAAKHSLMGVSKLPEGVEVLSSSQVAFSGGGPGDRYDQVGLVADVVQELKLVFAELEASGGGKVEFLRRVAQIKEDFGELVGHPSLGAINGFIRERALFPVSDAELDELWY